MGLLGWNTLQPHNNTAAILYPAPVRVSSIRVFPTGAQPFANSLETVATTEPEAFFLDVFFNAYSTRPPAAHEKPVVKNALAPTRIVFAGGTTEYTVDMGSEVSTEYALKLWSADEQQYATRLIIFRGDFESLSVAIYGETVADTPEVDEYKPSQLPADEPIPLSPSIDLGNSFTPTSLAEQLLTLLPVTPSLPLVSRLVFSLKPEQEDWDDPDFPYLYADLDDHSVLDLEGLVQSITRPIKDDVSSESLVAFATRMHDDLGSNPSDDAYFVAKLLTKAASQQTRFSKILLEHIDLPAVFNEESLDDTTVLCLRDAVANVEIARYFSSDEPFIKALEEMRASSRTEPSVQKALNKLFARLHGWQTFENALSVPEGDFNASADFLEDITMGEHSLGCWLECMLTHDNLISKLAATPVPNPKRLPPLLFHRRQQDVSHVQFITFVRAVLGVCAVLADLAWADSIGNNACRERALGVLTLWQNVDGYREIVNHCLLLRQLTKRLGWNKSDDVPSKSAVLAERLLVTLGKDPRSMLREHMVETVLSLEPPFAFIEAEEMLELGKLARVVRDGISSAAEELAYKSLRPFSLRRLRVLRLSMAIVQEELTYDDGELHVLETFWDERSQGICPTLIPLLRDIADDLHHHFILVSSVQMNQPLAELLLRSADDLLHLILRFVFAYPLASRDLRNLANAIVTLYMCAQQATTQFSPHSTTYLAAQTMQTTCTSALSTLLNPASRKDTENLDQEVILRSVLGCANQSGGRDPVAHIRQLYNLLDTTLPRAQALVPNGDSGATHSSSYSIASILPKILYELETFVHLLDPEKRAECIGRLDSVDNDETGVAEWLLVEELKQLSAILDDLSTSRISEGDRLVVWRYQVSSYIQFLEVLVTSPSTANWAISSLTSNPDLSQYLADCISLLLNTHLSSPHLTRLTEFLSKHSDKFESDPQFDMMILILRNTSQDPTSVAALAAVPVILRGQPEATIAEECNLVRREICKVFVIFQRQTGPLPTEAAETLLQILEWLSANEDNRYSRLTGLSVEALTELYGKIYSAIPSERHDSLQVVEAKLTVDEDEIIAQEPVELPSPTGFVMPLHAVEDLLSMKPFEPSTPKNGTKTPDILGVVISPPTAILRSPAATGLTKTYVNNDFRQLRQVQSARLNTSRLPSTHVDVSFIRRAQFLEMLTETQDFALLENPAPEMLLAPAMHLDPSPIVEYQDIIPGL
ncbi:hypothetical protein D9619_000594 [Psilocybe cf. subviscida]|uniref:Virilizer N-terminal domain-containing protein n=1 Tax=Psilocybe cf. subviscida TaxID=2480587 RepID=A0A8H5BEZ8_9AGAR|nr:hypothetical protein D9619_000594 [Psilocybe cf. subviscida]